MAELSTLIVKLATDNSALERGLKSAEGEAASFGGRLTSGLQKAGTLAAGALVTGVGAGVAAVGGVLASAIPLASEFQSQLVGLEIAAGASGLSFDQLHDAALAVGGDTELVGVSATGAADAMTGLYKAGLTTTEIFGDLQGYMAGTADLGGALRGAIDLAAATELDMVQASDLAAVALATFGAELETETERAEFITFALDNMVKAADASVAEVGDLEQALKNVGPTAATLGVPIEDINNALAILSTRGITGAEAGTALKSMLANLQRPTAAVTEQLEALGISLFDAEGSFIGLPALVGDLESAMSDLTQEERSLAAQTLAGTFGMNALNTLIGEGATGWDAMAEATANAAGIQEQALAKADTFAGRMEALDGALETVKISIGEAFLPVLQSLVETFAGFVETHGPAIASVFASVGGAVGQVFTQISNGVEPLTAVVGGISSLIMAFGGSSETVQAFNNAVSGVVATVRRAVDPVIKAVSGFVEWQDVAIALAVAIGAVLLPIIGGIIAAVAPVIAIFAAVTAVVALLRTAWENNFLGIQDKTRALIAFLMPVFEDVRAWLGENIPVALQFLSDLWSNDLQPAIQAVAQYIERNVIPIWQAIIGVWRQITNVVGRALVGLWQNQLAPQLEVVYGIIKERLLPVWESFKGIIGLAKDALAGFASIVGDAVNWLNTLADKIGNVSLPDWMTPGSPTPLEMGLRGITKATREASAAFGEANFGAGFGVNAPAIAAAGGGGLGSAVVNVYIYGGDRDEVAAGVGDGLERAGITADLRGRMGG